MGIINNTIVEALYIQYQHAMYGYALRVIKDTYLAEDIVHEAVIKLLKYGRLHIDGLQSGQTRRLIYLVTERTAITYYNKRQKAPFCHAEAEYISALPDGSDFTQAVEIRDLLARLPPVYADILFLRVKCGYDYKAIGKLLGIKPGTARNRFVEAKKACRQWELAGEGSEHEK